MAARSGPSPLAALLVLVVMAAALQTAQAVLSVEP